MRFCHSVDIYAATISRSHELIESASVQAETFDGDGQNAAIDDSGLTCGDLSIWKPGLITRKMENFFSCR